MPLKPTPGKRIDNSAKMWGDIVEIINMYKRGLLTNPRDLSSSDIDHVFGINTEDSAYNEGCILQIDGASSGYDLSSPNMNLIEPVWHSNIDNLVPVPKLLRKQEAAQLLNKRWAIIRLKDDPTDEDLGEKRFVFLDPEDPSYGKIATSGIWKILDRVEENKVLVDTSLNQPLWKYKMNEDWSEFGTDSELHGLDDEVFSTSIALLDTEKLMEDQKADDTGYCLHVANQFIAIAANC